MVLVKIVMIIVMVMVGVVVIIKNCCDINNILYVYEKWLFINYLVI